MGEVDPSESEARTLYEGKPLDVKAAESFFTAVTPTQLAALAESILSAEQRPARMMLELVGDTDCSWANACTSLRDGANFKKEVLEMEAAKYVTRKSIERFEALGKLDPQDLQDGDPAAFAMSVYLEAIIWAAREKLGMNEVPLVVPLAIDEEPPLWPMTIGIKEIPVALSDALKWRRTPLFLCNGKAQIVDTYFTYQSCSLIEAKWILKEVDVKREMDVDQMRERLRRRLVAGLKFGQPIHISMGKSAVNLKTKYCTDTELPEGLFKQDLWFQRSTYSKIIREADLADWPGAFPGRMRYDSASYVFVTSDFSLESAKEFLPSVLPYFTDMAIIEVDPSSIN